jgi:Leucine-rich repeat (LRR) protein
LKLKSPLHAADNDYVHWLPDGIENLSRLEVFRLSYEQCESIPSWIGNLTNLKELSLEGMTLQDLDDILSVNQRRSAIFGPLGTNAFSRPTWSLWPSIMENVIKSPRTRPKFYAWEGDILLMMMQARVTRSNLIFTLAS